ncbi:hypothetical protein ACQPZJ_44845 [Actinoplanes sp. CA-054009]
MACGLLNPIACAPLLADPAASVADPAASMADTIVDGVLSQLADAIAAAIKAVVGMLGSWLLIPTPAVCPAPQPSGAGPVSGDWVTQCQAAGTAATLRGYVLPITLLIAVVGLLWQAIVMTVTRKGEPLLQVVRGLWNTALWGAVGIAGTQLAVHAGDSFANWIILTALRTGDPGTGSQTFDAALGGMLVAHLASTPIVGILAGIVIIIVVIVQTVLLIFRAAAITILAGMLQLAAAGSFTRATSPWMSKVTGSIVALIAYKPVAALVYATGLAFMSDHESTANFVVGLAVLALSVVALPAMAKFFNWTVGSVQSSSGIGIFGAGAAAGVHAASSLRGLGGNSAAEHGRYMDSHGPGSSGPGSPGPTGSGGPSGPAAPGGGSASPVIDGAFRPTGPTGAGVPGTATTAAVPGAAATGGTAGAASTGAAAGGAGAGAAAASGPAAPVVLGAVVATQAATSAANSAAGSAKNAMGGE